MIESKRHKLIKKRSSNLLIGMVKQLTLEGLRVSTIIEIASMGGQQLKANVSTSYRDHENEGVAVWLRCQQMESADKSIIKSRIAVIKYGMTWKDQSPRQQYDNCTRTEWMKLLQ